ncbi:MAG: hypothetical protein IM319_11705 [Microcystis sp. M113S1]|uniref:hypothetical protein n=1 Tax=Microcystis sp. M113S1 TaxID=2771104 RepID=UPI002589F3F7|nr:hypothetical protein [Microcystis sp. M113S1]MCA2939784.1 hypothetical protein [Microcystis sp. M113S1]
MLKAINVHELSSQEPLKFLFYYQENGEAIISNTIYLKDGDEPLKLYLKVFNDSSDVVTFKDPKCRSEESEESVGYYEEASSTNCHFHLRFEKDLGLNPNEIQIEQSSDSDQWLFRCDEEEHFFSIYFLHKQELKLSQDGNITICFLNLTANNRTVKTSNVEVLYGGKKLVWKGQNQKHIEDEISSRIAISVINHLSKTKIPLQFRVLGSNKILNDGTTKNTLILKVINSPLSNNEREILLLDQSSKFIVSFEQGDHPDALVARTGQLNAVQINVTGLDDYWVSEHTANTPQWSFTPTISQLIAGQGIELTISNLVTSSASGLACIYIDYQNIGSYPDGRLVIPIEKTPLLYSGQNVGIRNNDPRIDLAIGDNDTGLQQQGDGELAIYTDNFERVRVNKKGNVGIGTDNPQAQLHVNGGDAVISGKVGIGTTTPTAKLHVNGGNAVISGKVGIGTTNPNIHLAIGDNDTGLHLEDSQNLSLMVKGKQRVAMPDGKPVVISGGLAVGLNSTPIERILCGKVVVRDDIKPMYPDVYVREDIKRMYPGIFEEQGVFFREDVPMGLLWEPQVLFDTDGMALYGNKIDRGFRIGVKNTGEIQINFEEPFNSEEVDKAIVLLTSLDGECTVHLLSISPFRVITRDAKTQERKDASFNFVIILPTSSDRKYLGCFK